MPSLAGSEKGRGAGLVWGVEGHPWITGKMADNSKVIFIAGDPKRGLAILIGEVGVEGGEGGKEGDDLREALGAGHVEGSRSKDVGFVKVQALEGGKVLERFKMPALAHEEEGGFAVGVTGTFVKVGVRVLGEVFDYFKRPFFAREGGWVAECVHGLVFVLMLVWVF